MSLLVTFLFACTTATPPDDLDPSAGGKADDGTLSMRFCGVRLVHAARSGVGEVGEDDLPPRSTSNALSAKFNAESHLDCINQIDMCFMPHYYVDDNEKIFIEIANTEVVRARSVYVDGELVAEQLPGMPCTHP